MPLIDVTEVLLDPDFVDTFQVIRRTQTDGDNGRPVINEQLITPVYGTVQSAGANDLLRLPESERAGKHLSIVTMTRLYPASTGFQPDLVVWPPGGADRYVVVAVDDYSRHGPGFVQVIAKSMGSTEAPPA